jgi:hypothetical protein
VPIPIPTLGALALAAAAVLQPAATPVDPVQVSCEGGVVYWSATPGLSTQNRPHRFAATGDLGTCVSAGHPDITGGQIWFEGYGRGACPGGVTGGSARMYITWNTGDKSQAQGSWHATPDEFGLSTGKVLSGLFEGGVASFAGSLDQATWTQCTKGQVEHGEADMVTGSIVSAPGP